MTARIEIRRPGSPRRRLGKKDGAPDRKIGVREESGRPGTPDWPPGKKKAVREAEKRSGQAKRPSGKLRKCPGSKMAVRMASSDPLHHQHRRIVRGRVLRAHVAAPVGEEGFEDLGGRAVPQCAEQLARALVAVLDLL